MNKIVEKVSILWRVRDIAALFWYSVLAVKLNNALVLFYVLEQEARSLVINILWYTLETQTNRPISLWKNKAGLWLIRCWDCDDSSSWVIIWFWYIIKGIRQVFQDNDGTCLFIALLPFTFRLFHLQIRREVCLPVISLWQRHSRSSQLFYIRAKWLECILNDTSC